MFIDNTIQIHSSVQTYLSNEKSPHYYSPQPITIARIIVIIEPIYAHSILFFFSKTKFSNSSSFMHVRRLLCFLYWPISI